MWIALFVLQLKSYLPAFIWIVPFMPISIVDALFNVKFCLLCMVMPEITWLQLQCRFTSSFETLLDEEVIEGWCDSGNTLHLFVALLLFL
jgi:hypothetical protein